jgi:mannosyltransferase OCH1-like enzyme
MTPRLLHQTWKNYDLPNSLRFYQQRWKDLGYEYRFYTDEDLRNVIQTYFPHYLKTYDSFTHNIERVDFARYAILYVFGGIYADMDTVPTKPLDPFLKFNKIVLGSEPIEHTQKYYNRRYVICNALMISPPHEEYWLSLMKYIVANYEKNYEPVYNTGPMAMTYHHEKYPLDLDRVILTTPCTFFLITDTQEISKECNIEDAYVMHMWNNSWVKEKHWWESKRIYNHRYWFYGLLILFFIIWTYRLMKIK